jgi:HAD superfamily hydrolase (TIGR01493 family)
MAAFRPTYITFDCYGTLIDFQMSHMTRTLFAERLAPDRLQAFTTDFSAYRFDEVLGEWQPYADVITQALRRSCKRWGLPYREAEAQRLYEAIPTWGPHPDVPAALARVAQAFPLVILSNAADSQIHRLLWLPHAAGPGWPACPGGAGVRRGEPCVRTSYSPSIAAMTTGGAATSLTSEIACFTLRIMPYHRAR